MTAIRRAHPRFVNAGKERVFNRMRVRYKLGDSLSGAVREILADEAPALDAAETSAVADRLCEAWVRFVSDPGFDSSWLSLRGPDDVRQTPRGTRRV